jgi:hypothetical protein
MLFAIGIYGNAGNVRHCKKLSWQKTLFKAVPPKAQYKLVF